LHLLCCVCFTCCQILKNGHLFHIKFIVTSRNS
jgi:hypothetical protein